MLFNNRNLKKLSFNLMILLGASTVATNAADNKIDQETAGPVSSLTARFNSPIQDKSFSRQVEGDVMTVSPHSARTIVSSLKAESEFRAQKLVEEAKRQAQVEIDGIKQASQLEIEEIKKAAGLEKEEIETNLTKIRADAELEIKKIHEGVEAEKAKAELISAQLEALKQEKEKLEKELSEAKADAVVTWSGMKEKTSNVFSFLPGSSYFSKPSPSKDPTTTADQS